MPVNPDTRKMWTPQRQEAAAQCASCPFRLGNDQEFAPVVAKLREQAGLKGPVKLLHILGTRLAVFEDLKIRGDFSCHSTVYNPDMTQKDQSQWRQCPGATKAYKTRTVEGYEELNIDLG